MAVSGKRYGSGEAMSELRAKLERRLEDIPGLTVDCWKDTDLVCLFFEGKDFAHFHGDDILDIRLSAKIIRQEGLSRSVSNQIHPGRSQNSRWIGVEIKNENDLRKVVRLVEQACGELG
jgi:hypothetical protein